MKQFIILSSLTTAVLLAFVSPASAIDPPIISYQGVLSDDSGSPPPDDSYQITVRLFDEMTEGTLLWTEAHRNVAVTQGRFRIQLGSVIPFDMATLATDPLYLEIQVGSDTPMTPRALLTSAPRSVISRRVRGDILTEQGTIQIHPPDPGSQGGIQISAEDSINYIHLNPIHPPEPGLPPVIAFNTTLSSGANLFMFNPQPEPPAIGDPWIAMHTGVGTGASLLMFNPQPEPPAYPLLEMNTQLNRASFEMTSNQAAGAGSEIVNPMLEAIVDSLGVKLNLQKSFMDDTGLPDKTGIRLSADSLAAKAMMFGPGFENSPTLQIISDADGSRLGLDTTPTNVITVGRSSPTNPIATAWTVYSSKRWKTNIKTIENPLKMIMNLRGVSYDRKSDGKHDIGLIAEEVGEVIPEIVEYEVNGTDAKSVDYSRLVAILIEAAKEQQTTIDELKTELRELKRLYGDLAVELDKSPRIKHASHTPDLN